MNEPIGYGLMVNQFGWWVTLSKWRDSEMKLFNSERVAMFDKRGEAIAFGFSVLGGDTRSPAL